MKIIADTHCHTIASTHAYSTAYENIQEAKKMGLKFIAITDHSGDMPGSPGPWYFENLKVIPKEVDGVGILKGVESNVLNEKGEIDLPTDLTVPLDWVIASIHEPVFFGNHDIDDCTQLWINVAKNPLVNVIGHSGLMNFKYDYEKVIPIFGENGKLIEINNSSFTVREGSAPNCKKIALLCKKYGVPIIINSDSHFCKQIGRFDKAISLLKEIDFPENLVINANVETFKAYLEKYTNYYK